MLFAGCVTKNPNYVPSQPASALNPAYVSDTNGIAKFEAYIDKARSVNQMSAPVNPYSGAIETGLGFAASGLVIVSGLYARLRNVLSAHKKATQTLADTVATNGGQGVAMANAPDGATAAIMASHFQSSPLPNVGNAVKA